MKYSKAKSGPFARRLFIPPRDMEEMTQYALREVGLMPSKPQPIKIDRFIEERFGISEAYIDMPEDYLGAAKFNRVGVKAILVSRKLSEDSSRTSQRRVRSTIGHEAGHGLCHEDLWVEKIRQHENQLLLFEENHPFDGLSNNGFMCASAAVNDAPSSDENDDEPPSKAKSPWWEIQANMAMASLLLPWPLITYAAQGHKERILKMPTPREYARIEASIQLADIFDVNPIMVRYRLQKWWGDWEQGFGF